MVNQATRSEKRAASVGLRSFHHTNATAMGSGYPSAESQATPRAQRQQCDGELENYTHTFTQDERDAAEKLGEFVGTG